MELKIKRWREQMKPNPVVGQELFMLNIGNAARKREQVLLPVKVVAVGRKYFTVQTSDKWEHEYQFHIDTWAEKTNYSPCYCLYETAQELEDEKEANALFLAIRKAHFDTYGRVKLSLSQLRKIAEIIELT
jgi:hypothetical protein